MTAAQPPTPRPLAANDVSILFPAPRNAKDLANLIPLSTLNGPAGSGRVWSDADFNRFLAIAEDPAVQVAGGLPRFDCPPKSSRSTPGSSPASASIPGAPGLSKEIIEQYGQQPQIRFIAQPVTQSGGTFQVHDIAAHLIFSYSASTRARAVNRVPAPPQTGHGRVSARHP